MSVNLIELAKAVETANRSWKFYVMQDISSATLDQIADLAVCADHAYKKWLAAKAAYNKAIKEAAPCA